MTPPERLAIEAQLAAFRRESEALQDSAPGASATDAPDARALPRDELAAAALAFEWAAELLADLLLGNRRTIPAARAEAQAALQTVERELARAVTPEQRAVALARRAPLVALASFLDRLAAP